MTDTCASGWATLAEPSGPVAGECHVVGPSATGAFAGHTDEIAAYVDGGWLYFAPVSGMRVWGVSNARLMVYQAGAWRDMAALGADTVPDALGEGAAPLVGVNGAADAANRLTVKSDAALFSHDDVTPGSGDMRVAVNKAGAASTAGVLFQTGYSGRAEFGLAGSDAFSVKVSADGATWNSSFSVVPADGRLKLEAPLDGNGHALGNV